jgi:nucleoside 2-deoxyribosyltransferase
MVSLILRASRHELIYLAGPLFSEAERRFNLELTPLSAGD